MTTTTLTTTTPAPLVGDDRRSAGRAPRAADRPNRDRKDAAAAGAQERLGDGRSLFVSLAVAQGAVVCLWPAMATIALGLWWSSNTIAHNFIHRPFFRRRSANVVFSLYLSGLLGIPQSLWRQRHLAHHAGQRWRFDLHALLVAETLLVLVLWSALLAAAPWFFLTAYLPGWLAGLALCAVHGHYEHRGGTTSYYGRLYNALFFNDGYHVEHHASPGRHWRRLPEHIDPAARTSRWPSVLRWMESLAIDARRLDTLECLVLRSRLLQRFVVRRHARALRRLRERIGPVNRVAIVGGGLFPRTVLVARRVLPEAELVVIDASARNVQIARAFVDADVDTIRAWYDPARHTGFDLVIVPLAYVGDREALYTRPPAPKLLVHDWLWRRRGTGAIVSLLLLKRLNLVESLRADRCEPPDSLPYSPWAS
jgi:hypothetical protein